MVSRMKILAFIMMISPLSDTIFAAALQNDDYVCAVKFRYADNVLEGASGGKNSDWIQPRHHKGLAVGQRVWGYPEFVMCNGSQYTCNNLVNCTTGFNGLLLLDSVTFAGQPPNSPRCNFRCL